jgi:glyceraldehyde 3-phosphate dehydrogenase
MNIAINGFGRIGRTFFRQAFSSPEIDIVAINDLGDIENLAYLLKYDSVYGKSDFSISTKGKVLIIDGKNIPFFQEKDPSKLPWDDLGVIVALESTGVFTKYKDAAAHRRAGAKRVVISANAKGDPVPGIKSETVLMGVNTEDLATCSISANASCTTNAASPIITILEEAFNIEKALLDTIHGYTSSQNLVDGPSGSKDWRRGRAAAINIVPSTTGAATAITKAVPGVPFFDGISIRVPVVTGSYVDLTVVTKSKTDVEGVNDILRKAAKEERWKGVFTVSEEPLVSSDIIGNTHGSIADLAMTRVAGGDLIKVLSWYDNEAGYVGTLVKHVIETGKYAIR